MSQVKAPAEAPNTLDEIFENANRTFRAAQILRKARQHSASVHMSIACWEECSKYLIIFTRDHLPPDIFRRRYQHIQKFALANCIYFLAGGMSMAYSIDCLIKSGLLGKASDMYADALANVAQWHTPKSLASMLMSYLTKERPAADKLRLAESLKETETLRTQSVYVDLDENLNVTKSPAEIDKKKSLYWIGNARTGIALLGYLRSKRPSMLVVIKKLPPEMRRDCFEHTKAMQRNLRKVLEK